LNKHEDLFIRKSYQRDIILNICLNDLDSGEESELCPSCSTTSTTVYKLYIRSMCNILLNNYTNNTMIKPPSN